MKDSQLSSLVTPILERFALELEEITVRPAGRRRLLRVVVDGDGPEGRGPLLDDIAEATQAISSALDSADTVGNSPYTLEVTSRGVSRPLTAPRHWRRNRGRRVLIHLADGSDLDGRIEGSDDDGVDLEVEGTRRRVSYEQVRKAVVQVEFNRSTEAEASDEEA